MWNGSRAERHFPIILPVIAEYTEEKTIDGEHPLAFRESPTILAASQPMRRQFRHGWTRKNGYMSVFSEIPRKEFLKRREITILIKTLPNAGIPGSAAA